MDPCFIQGLVGRVIPFAPAVIQGYRRETFVEEGKRGFRLIPQEGGVVMGVVLVAPSEEEVATLDRFEQVPEVMVKKTIQVSVGDLERTANIYMSAHA